MCESAQMVQRNGDAPVSDEHQSGNGERSDRKVMTVSRWCVAAADVEHKRYTQKHFELNQAWAYYALLFGAEP